MPIFKCAEQKISAITQSDARYALNDLTRNKNIVLKKADKGSTTVIMNRQDKVRKHRVYLTTEGTTASKIPQPRRTY